MAKPEFAMSMFASKADLYKAKAEYYERELTKLRDQFLAERENAANPPPYMDEEDYAAYNGKELAYDEVVLALNNLL